MKLTKDCLYPWMFMQIHAGGMIQHCAIANDMDMGDFIIDHCQRVARGEPSRVLDSPSLMRLREGLLTGNLRPMCRRCFFRPEELITTDELIGKLKAYYKGSFPAGTDIDSLDLIRTSKFYEMCISFTNRCNSRCVYCVQSVLADTNPYFKMDFPDEFAESTLDFFAAQGINQIRSCVEGEPTLYKKWCDVITAFKNKYPHIDLYMTTNLSRRYSDKEIELLARYKVLDISIDTLDPELYKRMRPGSNLPLVLENLQKVKAKKQEMGLWESSRISVHSVVSDQTWHTLDELAEYAFANGFIPMLGSFEERPNSLAFQKGLCKPLTAMPEEEQIKAQKCIAGIKERIEAMIKPLNRGYIVDEFVQGGLLYNLTRSVERDYDRFKPFDDNPLIRAFHRRYPKGTPEMALNIAYDHDNIAYNGVMFAQPGVTLHLDGFEAGHAVVREVSLYKPGHASVKYDQTVLPGYRKTIEIKDSVFEYTPVFADNVDQILVEVSEWW